MRPISGVANLGRSALDRPIHRMYDGLYLAPARPGLGCVSYVCGAWRVSTGVACAYLLGPLSVVCDCEELWRKVQSSGAARSGHGWVASSECERPTVFTFLTVLRTDRTF